MDWSKYQERITIEDKDGKSFMEFIDVIGPVQIKQQMKERNMKQFQSDLIDAAKKRCDVREYPLGGTEKLISKLSKYLKVPSNMVGIGNGSDQILDLFLANFCTRKTKILTSDPTFAFFEERCKLYGVKMIKIPFSEGMTLDIDQFLSKSKNADLIYIDSPNNPTGFQFSKQNKKIR